MPDIGKLERVDLREVWNHEAYDFTQWMENNIAVLNDALDLTLVNVDREQAAGIFSVDLVAEDEAGAKVIIENQLEKSNHDHLGKLITYLTAMQAKAAIWIVSDPRPEHVAAITWLNESSSAAFYMVKVEAVRIGGSLPAPLFTLIVGPSEDAQDVGAAKREFAERYGMRRRWWTTLIERSASVNKLHAHITPDYGGAFGEDGVEETRQPGHGFGHEITRDGFGVAEVEIVKVSAVKADVGEMARAQAGDPVGEVGTLDADDARLRKFFGEGDDDFSPAAAEFVDRGAAGQAGLLEQGDDIVRFGAAGGGGGVSVIAWNRSKDKPSASTARARIQEMTTANVMERALIGGLSIAPAPN